MCLSELKENRSAIVTNVEGDCNCTGTDTVMIFVLT